MTRQVPVDSVSRGGTTDLREVKSAPSAPGGAPGPAVLRQRLLNDMHNVELRQKYLATRSPDLARADLCHARRRLLAIELAGRVAGLALVGAFGACAGFVLLAEVIPGIGPFAAAVKIGVGSAAVAGLAFALLGACGHVVFAEIVGDYRERRRRRVASFWPFLVDTSIEFVGGAAWGTVSGMLVGAAAGVAAFLLSLDGAALPSLIGAGTMGGSVLGLLLASLAIVARCLSGLYLGGEDYAALGPLPLASYLGSAGAARRKFLRRSRSTVKAPGAPPPQLT